MGVFQTIVEWTGRQGCEFSVDENLKSEERNGLFSYCVTLQGIQLEII